MSPLMTDADMIEAMARTLTDDIKTMEFVAEHDGDHDTVRETLRQAIACIRALTAENEALQEKVERYENALEPFAKRAEHIPDDEADDMTYWHPAVGSPITVADLRRARSELEG